MTNDTSGLVERVQENLDACVEAARMMEEDEADWPAVGLSIPDLRALLALLEQRTEALRDSLAAMELTYAAHKAAREMVPNDEEGLAAQVFAYHINATEGPLIQTMEFARASLNDKEGSNDR